MKKTVEFFKKHYLVSAGAALAMAVIAGLCIAFALNSTVLRDDSVAPQTVSETVTVTDEIRRYMNAREVSNPPEFYIADDAEDAPDATEDAPKTIKVTYIADGSTTSVYTTESTVGSLFNLAGVSVGERDRIERKEYTWSESAMGSLSWQSGLEDSMVVNVVRVDSEYVQKEITVAYTTTYRNNADMNKGTTRVVQAGVNGKTVETYKIVRENGEIVSNEKVSTQVVSYPVTQIIEVGTGNVFYASDGTSYPYTKKIYVKLTGYTACYEDTHKNPGDPGFGITYSGRKARVGIVACDPNYIPLNTNLYVTIEGRADYGYCWTGDIGGGVKGNHLDLYFSTKAESDAFGVRYGYAYVLKKQVGYPF